MGCARVVMVFTVVLAAAGLLHCSLRNLDDLVDDTTLQGADSGGSGGTSGNGTSGSSGNGTSGSNGTTTNPDLPPTKVQCATTDVVCEITSAECCVMYNGEDSAAARSFLSSSAKCQAPGGNCGTFISTGDTFSNQLRQGCSTSANCSGQSCCVLPVEQGQRLSKNISAMQCLAQADCSTKGRIVCVTSADCPTNTSCLPETDPILSRFYANFCR